MTEEILVNYAFNVATITLNRPKLGNSLTTSMVEKILSTLKQIREDDNIRVVVLTGNGKFFCTGMDLSSIMKDPNEGYEIAAELFRTLDRFPKPVIARINGPAIGGGVGLVFTADVRIASMDAFFCLPEVRRGLIPAIIAQYILPEVGRQKAREFMLTGRKVAAHEATFLSVVTDTSSLDHHVQAYVDMLLESAPGAMAKTKRLIGLLDDRGPESEEYTRHTFLSMLDSEEALIGIAAYMNKSKPIWQLATSRL